MSDMMYQSIDTVYLEMLVKETNNRRLHLNEEFNEQSVFKLCYGLDKCKDMDDLKNIPMDKREPIWIVINSYGGYCHELASILGKIEYFKSIGYKIYTLSTGKAMSCGFILALSGTKKYCYRYNTFMYHSVSSGAWGKTQELKESVEETNRLNEWFMEYTLNNSGITRKRLEEVNKCKLDWYITPEEALKLKIVDEVL